MFKYTIAAVAALGVLAGSPALASGKVKSAESAATNQQADASRPTRYCYVVPATTGTILDRKVCKTLDQWRAEGVDPTKQQKN
jgi:hypothetical protein